MTMATPSAVEAEIHAIMQDRIEAVHAKDAARLVSHHAVDVVAYDLLEPLQYKGAADLRRRAQQWFDGYDGPMTYEIRDLAVVPGHGVAFCHGLHHVAGRLRLIDDKWQIVHEHSSLPFDMATGKVSFALKP
jgi:ketosteroid isomerase-like protein